MSSRALRKLQKQQEELQHLNNAQADDESEADEASKPYAPNAFSILIDTADSDDHEVEGAHTSGLEDANDTVAMKQDDALSPSAGAKQDKARKRKKKKSKAGKTDKLKDVSERDKFASRTSQLDEIDLALQHLSAKSWDGSRLVEADSIYGYPEMCHLLGVESKLLNALNEMKRLFGNVVLEGDGEGLGTPIPGRRRSRGLQQLDLGEALASRHSPVSRGQGLTGLALRRNVFMAGREEWPKATSGGLGMEVVEKQRNGSTLYRFVHNKYYQDVQSQFESCVASMEPQRLVRLLQFNRKIFSPSKGPRLTYTIAYHISTLLQVSEVGKHQGDNSLSGDLLERALFSFGRSVHSSFTTALSEGKARLDFRHPENREFWLGAWRYIINLGQKGTWRTAYEWAKLILSLDPQHDPFRVVLVIDQLALRAGQSAHFLKLSNSSYFSEQWRSCPNIQISSSLAEYKSGNHSKALDTLTTAASAFPWIFARLFRELDIEHIPKTIWGKEPRTEREKFDCEAYVHGTKDLWNTPKTIHLLKTAAESATNKLSPRDYNPITLQEARHILLSGTPSLISLIPRNFTSMFTNSSDPLPPLDSISSYIATASLGDQPQYQHASEDSDDDLPGILDQRIRDEDPGRPLEEAQRIRDEDPGRPLEEAHEEAQELRGLQSWFARLIPWLAPRDDPAPPIENPNQDLIHVVANGTGVTQEQLAARGARLMELLRRTLGRDPMPEDLLLGSGEEVAGASDHDRVTHTATDTENPTTTARLPVSVSFPTVHPPPSSAEDIIPPASEPTLDPYNDERNQRWLAGQGMIGLRTFIVTHGADDAAWSSPDVAAEGRSLVEEYARRVGLLREERSRRFIVDYVLRQGAGSEARDLVLGEMERDG